jgi:dCTP deaminase
MPVKSDRWIAKMASECEMIAPFEQGQIRRGISFGTSSYGYDISLHDDFKIFAPCSIKEMDPKCDNSDQFETITADSVLIQPNSFILARSREYFKIPRDIITVCFGKSTYARNGVIVNVTPFEPEWEGYATISVSNTGPLPARIYAHEGIAQLLFLQADEICAESYQDKKGKYQAQKKITHSKI